jgi:hypothetical protein
MSYELKFLAPSLRVMSRNPTLTATYRSITWRPPSRDIWKYDGKASETWARYINNHTQFMMMSVHVPSKKQYINLLLSLRLGNVAMVIATWFKLGTAASSLNLLCHCGARCVTAAAGIMSIRQAWLVSLHLPYLSPRYITSQLIRHLIHICTVVGFALFTGHEGP